MKKTTSLLFLFFECLFISFVQGQELNYCDYHKAINKVEISIANHQIEEALQKYDSLFKIYPIHFSSDLYNAALCGLILGKKDKAIEYCRLIIEKGDYTVGFLEKQPGFKRLIKTKAWKRFKRQIPTLIVKSNVTIDSTFFKIRHALFRAEQDNSNNQLEFYKATYNSTKTLFGLFVSHPEDLQLMFQGNFTEYGSMMRHYYELFYFKNNSNLYADSVYYKELDLNSYNLDSLYRIAVKKGYLSPKNYADAHDYKGDYKEMLNAELKVFVFRDSSNIIVIQPTQEEIGTSNKLRQEFGLPTYEEYIYKVAKTDILLNNYPMNEFKKMLARLEKDKKYLKLDRVNQGEVFSNEFFNLHDKVVSKVKLSQNGLFYCFTFSSNSFVFNPNDPDVGSSNKAFLANMYLQIIRTHHKLNIWDETNPMGI